MKKTSFLCLIVMAALSATSCKTSEKMNADNASTAVTTQQLAGKWEINTVFGSPAKAEKDLFIEFLPENRIHGEVGCNIYNSSYTIDPAKGELKFAENGQLTMMFCPDMATEDSVLKAIRATRKYRLDEGGKCLSLLDENGKLLMKICR